MKNPEYDLPENFWTQLAPRWDSGVLPARGEQDRIFSLERTETGYTVWILNFYGRWIPHFFSGSEDVRERLVIMAKDGSLTHNLRNTFLRAAKAIEKDENA